MADDCDLKELLREYDESLSLKLSVCVCRNSSCGFLRPVMKALELSCHGIPWILGTIVAFYTSHSMSAREKSLNLFVALIIDVLIVALIKVTFRRSRPQNNRMDMFATVNIDQYSFPSGHAARAVMVAWFFLDNFEVSSSNNAVAWAIVLWAFTVSFSRITLGRHHVSDVIAGVALGLTEYRLLGHSMWLSSDWSEWIVAPVREDWHQ